MHSMLRFIVARFVTAVADVLLLVFFPVSYFLFLCPNQAQKSTFLRVIHCKETTSIVISLFMALYRNWGFEVALAKIYTMQLLTTLNVGIQRMAYSSLSHCTRHETP